MNLPAIAWLTSPDWALFSVSVTTVWVNTGFAFLVILGGLQNIDTSLYESASIDGASYLYKLRRYITDAIANFILYCNSNIN